MARYGWDSIFYTFAGVGLLLLVVWLFLAKDHPQTVTDVSSQTSGRYDGSVHNRPRPSTLELGVTMLQTSGAWALFGCHFLHSVGNFIALSWLPTYLEERWGFANEQPTRAMACAPPPPPPPPPSFVPSFSEGLAAHAYSETRGKLNLTPPPSPLVPGALLDRRSLHPVGCHLR
jgi:hypothetical protein